MSGAGRMESPYLDILKQGNRGFLELAKRSSSERTSILTELVRMGEAKAVVRHIGEFTDLKNPLAIELISSGDVDVVAKNLSRFTQLSVGVARALVAAGHADSIRKEEKSFAMAFDKEVGFAVWGIDVLRQLPIEMCTAELAEEVIARFGIESFATHVHSFFHLTPEIAQKLIAAGHIRILKQELNHFDDLDLALALQIVDSGGMMDVIEYIQSFHLDMSDPTYQEFITKAGKEFVVSSLVDNVRKTSIKSIVQTIVDLFSVNQYGQDIVAEVDSMVVKQSDPKDFEGVNTISREIYTEVMNNKDVWQVLPKVLSKVRPVLSHG